MLGWHVWGTRPKALKPKAVMGKSLLSLPKTIFIFAVA